MVPTAGVDYPGSYAELLAWFPNDEACLDYLEWLRWPAGFRCPACGCERGWRLASGRWECADCGRQVSVTAGTIFHRTRTPLTVWFAAVWLVTSQKYGVSALGLQRVLGLGSYQTAWMMLHRLRAAMVRPGRERLCGRVEVDETYVGGEEAGVQGRETQEKSIVAIAVEIKQPKGFGRVRLARVADVSASSLVPFVEANVEPGQEVLSDGWSGYRPLAVHGYTHTRTILSASGDPAHVAMPAVHRVASLLKRWLLGTHQGAVSPDHLNAYLGEFAFRFNRRSCRHRGLLFYRLLEQAVVTDPLSYHQFVVDRQRKSRRPTLPPTRRARPASLAIATTAWPWRTREPLNHSETATAA